MSILIENRSMFFYAISEMRCGVRILQNRKDNHP